MSTFKPCEDHSVTFTGWASTGTPDLKPWGYHPRPLGPKDIEIEISHCGICGSDIHTITGGWGPLKEHVIVGHEIVGKVAAVGADAHHKVGDIVGVGGLADACGECKDCKAGNEQLCAKKSFVFNDNFKDGRGGKSYGGFADRVRVHGDFAHKIPEKISHAEGKSICKET